jgi:hypothetical protein
MTEQQQQRQRPSINGTGTRNPATKSSSTTDGRDNEGGGSKTRYRKKAARDRKKARIKQQKKEGKEQATDNFVGSVTDTNHLLYKHVISPSGGNMAHQYRIYLKQIKLHCSSEGVYKLSRSISTRTILSLDDFLSPMPDPNKYSKEAKDDDGNIILLVDKPLIKMKLDTIWQATIDSEIAEWMKYESFSKGLFETTIGQLHDKVLATCRQDKTRWSAIENDNDLIGLLAMVEKISTQNKVGKKVYAPYENILTLERCLTYKQLNNVTNTEFAKQVNVM